LERVIVISSKLKNIDHVRDFLRDVFKEFNLNMAYFNRIFIGISEAVNNAILHGNQLNPEKNVFIKLKLKGNMVRITVKDEGNGYNQCDLVDPTNSDNIKVEHGRGIYILNKLADKVSIKEEGRKILIQFIIPE